MIYTISAGISDTPLRWQCDMCHEECVSRDIDGLHRLIDTHECAKGRRRLTATGRDYYGRTG